MCTETAEHRQHSQNFGLGRAHGLELACGSPGRVFINFDRQFRGALFIFCHDMSRVMNNTHDGVAVRQGRLRGTVLIAEDAPHSGVGICGNFVGPNKSVSPYLPLPYFSDHRRKDAEARAGDDVLVKLAIDAPFDLVRKVLKYV